MKISENLSLGPYMTFESSKNRPIHRWFYYKEGYSPEIVEYVLDMERTCCEGGVLLDPFCGTGTSLLVAKENGLFGIGVDASELAVFVSQVKCANYERSDLNEVEGFLRTLLKHKKEPSIKWNFELFNPALAFPRRNLNEILRIREAITECDCGENAKALLLLALISILPQCSIVIKDGGVLKIDKEKSAMPVKEAFKRKLRQMIKDIESTPIHGKETRIILGDARALPLENESCDVIVTSPPYLNNIDYSKVYGLELSLLTLDEETTKSARERLLSSFIKKRTEKIGYLPEVGDVGIRIPVVGAYFADMEKSLSEMKRVLKKDCGAYVIVSNSVIFGEHVLVDEILAAIGERLGMESRIIVGGYRIADVKPQRIKTRESVVVFRKQ